MRNKACHVQPLQRHQHNLAHNSMKSNTGINFFQPNYLHDFLNDILSKMMEKENILMLVLLTFGMALLGLSITLQDHLVGFMAITELLLIGTIITIVKSCTEEKMTMGYEEERARLHEEIDRLEAENCELWRLCYGSIDRKFKN
jgi:hypothetical protein